MGKWGGAFPLGTFLVNLTGSFFLCFLWASVRATYFLPSWLELALGTGFLGAYTTFSTYAYETLKLLEDGEKTTAFGYVLGSIAGGLAAGWCGLLLGSLLGGK